MFIDSVAGILATVTKISSTGWLNNKHLVLTGLEAGVSKIKALVDSMSGENLLRDS